ncbi:hypothetical protein D9619_008466 [Psilocybe cf. subviscida]|uniref:Cytochrome P450 monooxygenase CYP63 n=1 Tax=Psilocybe cf. subviscida TaxID=2480587 RepID=A0A8H5F102_9AGAR|nr:hypothetical protein D9619_008466 [Psilocybe cf. subviscida]
MNPANYRARFLLDVFRVLVVPTFALIAALLLLDCQLPSGWLWLPVDLIFIAAWAGIKQRFTDYRQGREAKAFGARSIPRAIGKWPGNVDILLRVLRAAKTGYIFEGYRQLLEEYQCRTLNLRILWSDSVISMDQEHMKFVLATGFHNFWRGRFQKERMEVFLGEGIFNRDDEPWKMHRAIARPFFAKERIRDFETFEKYTSKTLSILSTLSYKHEACDVQDLYARFSLDTASYFLFGRNLDTLSASLPIPGVTGAGPKGSATNDAWGSFSHAFDMCQINASDSGRIGRFWPLFELFKDKNEEHARAIRQFLDPLVQDAIAKKQVTDKEGSANSIADKNFLQHLADSTSNPSLIRDQLLSMLLASRDSTACALTYVTYFLALHPDVMKKLRAEITQHCGLSEAPTFDHFRDMKYLRSVINETLRLFPPVPLNVRETRSSPCLLPSSDRTYSGSSQASFKNDRTLGLGEHETPLYMPANTTILYMPLLIQRDPLLWGDTADEFDPERWIDPARLAKYVANPTMFTPFSAGPRICLGQNYAYNEMSYFIVRLLQQFDRFTLAPEFQPPGTLPPSQWKSQSGRQSFERIWPAAAITLYVKGGLWVRFHRRGEA